MPKSSHNHAIATLIERPNVQARVDPKQGIIHLEETHQVDLGLGAPASSIVGKTWLTVAEAEKIGIAIEFADRKAPLLLAAVRSPGTPVGPMPEPMFEVGGDGQPTALGGSVP